MKQSVFNTLSRVLFPFDLSRELRQFLVGLTFAALLSYNGLLTLGYGVAGNHGNSAITALLLVFLIVTLFALTVRRGHRPLAADYIFAGLVISIVISSLVNIRQQPPPELLKEHLLLAFTLACYAACRSISRDDIATVRSAFERMLAMIVLFGSIPTAIAMINHGENAHPIVLGFSGGATSFAVSLALLIIALVTIDKPRAGRTALVAAAIFLPASIFAAAVVRFTFLALGGSLLVAMILTQPSERRHLIAIAGSIFLAVIAAQVIRSDTTSIYYSGYLVETAKQTEAGYEIPSCNMQVNMMNSVAIRRALLSDALHLVPGASITGIGLDEFMKSTCIKEHQVHNSVLQAIIEFGWLTGALFLALIFFVIYPLVPLARQNSPIRFVLCSLVFALLMSLAHGRFSRDFSLFALLGCAAGLQRSGAIANTRPSKSDLLVPVSSSGPFSAP